jgi:hypothetical protein
VMLMRRERNVQPYHDREQRHRGASLSQEPGRSGGWTDYRFSVYERRGALRKVLQAKARDRSGAYAVSGTRIGLNLQDMAEDLAMVEGRSPITVITGARI